MTHNFKFGQPVNVVYGDASTAVQCRYWFTLRSGEKIAVVVWTHKHGWFWLLVDSRYVVPNSDKVRYPMPDKLRQSRWGLSWIDKWQEDYQAEERKRT